MKDYVEHTTESVRTIDAHTYGANYRDIRRFEALCAECPNYGCRWGCPPFTDEEYAVPDSYDSVDITLIKIELATHTPGDAATLRAIIDPIRAAGERRLLAEESRRAGHAALFTGQCPHCPGETCARTTGAPCRHPELVRPSLEALGFDLTRTASEIFGIDMLWCKDGYAPPYLTLIGALFYNSTPNDNI